MNSDSLTDNRMKLIRRNDLIISRVALVMALSFLCIQYTAGFMLVPILLSAFLCLLFNPYEFIPSMLIILSWLYIWTLVIKPSGRNHYRVGLALSCLVIAAAFPLWLYIHRSDPAQQPWAWYGVPATVFVLSTLVFIRWFYITKQESNSELSTK